jgi:hypothetical protein
MTLLQVHENELAHQLAAQRVLAENTEKARVQEAVATAQVTTSNVNLPLYHVYFSVTSLYCCPEQANPSISCEHAI